MQIQQIMQTPEWQSKSSVKCVMLPQDHFGGSNPSLASNEWPSLNRTVTLTGIVWKCLNLYWEAYQIWWAWKKIHEKIKKFIKRSVWPEKNSRYETLHLVHMLCPSTLWTVLSCCSVPSPKFSSTVLGSPIPANKCKHSYFSNTTSNWIKWQQ